MTASSSADKDQQVTLIEDFYGQRFYARQSNSSTDTKEACKKKKKKKVCSSCTRRPGPDLELATCLRLVYTLFTPPLVGSERETPSPTPWPLEILQPSLLSWISIFIFRDELCPGINYV